tara:strand:+ start:587 stop:796 length:210 start_codon:yes stop_codon:yes gene_type:complete
MSKIQAKINGIMDEIQAIMESDPRAHLDQVTDVQKLMASVGLYYTHMDDENKDYYQSVLMAIEDEEEWK